MIADELAQTNGDNDLTAWHDRWLWPCLRRMKSGHYRTTNCRTNHQTEPALTTRTNRELMPPASPDSSREPHCRCINSGPG
jgi:hypothetical protein